MKAAKAIAVASGNAAQEALWLRFRQGDRDAFSVIYRMYVNDLYNYGLHCCGDHERVQDGLQELFQELWQSRQHLSENVQHIKYYLLSSFRRKLLRTLRKDRRREAGLHAFDLELIPPREHQIIEDEIRKEQWQQLHQALDTLTTRQREAIYLRFFQNLSYQEVADMMSMKVDSVYNIISRSIGLLKETLGLPVLLLILDQRCR